MEGPRFGGGGVAERGAEGVGVEWAAAVREREGGEDEGAEARVRGGGGGREEGVEGEPGREPGRAGFEERGVDDGGGVWRHRSGRRRNPNERCLAFAARDESEVDFVKKKQKEPNGM